MNIVLKLWCLWRSVFLAASFMLPMASSVSANNVILETSSWIGGTCYQTQLTAQDLVSSSESSNGASLGFHDALTVAKKAAASSAVSKLLIRANRVIAKPIPGSDQIMFVIDFSAEDRSASGILQVFVLPNRVALLPMLCPPQ
jgi:hypothetical protein